MFQKSWLIYLENNLLQYYIITNNVCTILRIQRKEERLQIIISQNTICKHFTTKYEEY